MRAANLTAAVAIALWLGLAMLGRASLSKHLVDEVATWPTMASIDANILLPISVAAALLAWAWLCNAVWRRPWALVAPAVMCLGAIFPYLAIMGGGV